MARRRLAAGPEAEVPGVTNLQQLAAGGNSTVYRGWQPELDRWVAVKILGLTLSDPRARDRFLRECSAVGRLTGHPNIVTVLSSGVTRSDRPFLTMDLFERGSLADLVAASGPVPVDLALRYGVKLAGALETAHRAGILHRDLKPENVLVSRFGEPCLADFGIATLGEARGGTEAFTATHAAPEVLDGRRATELADVYGLGSTLWTALAGRLPFGDGAEGPLKLMLRVLQQPVPPLDRDDVPVTVEDALRWALAKDPADRPASAAALGERLRALQAELGLPVTDLVVPDDPTGLATAESSPTIPRPAPPPAAADAPPTIRPRRGPPAGAGPEAARPGAPAPPRPPQPEPVPPPVAWGSPPPLPVQGDPAADPGSDLEATIVRPRRGPAVEPEGATPRGRSSLVPTVAIVGGAVLVAVVMIVTAVVVTRGGDDPDAAAPPSTAAPVAPTATVPATSATTAPPPATRAPSGVDVRVLDPLTVVVTWRPPSDRDGLIGFVVAHRPKDGSGAVGTQAVNDPKAVEATVALPAPGARCFVVQAVYITGQGAPTDPDCT